MDNGKNRSPSGANWVGVNWSVVGPPSCSSSIKDSCSPSKAVSEGSAVTDSTTAATVSVLVADPSISAWKPTWRSSSSCLARVTTRVRPADPAAFRLEKSAVSVIAPSDTETPPSVAVASLGMPPMCSTSMSSEDWAGTTATWIETVSGPAPSCVAVDESPSSENGPPRTVAVTVPPVTSVTVTRWLSSATSPSPSVTRTVKSTPKPLPAITSLAAWKLQPPSDATVRTPRTWPPSDTEIASPIACETPPTRTSIEAPSAPAALVQVPVVREPPSTTVSAPSEPPSASETETLGPSSSKRRLPPRSTVSESVAESPSPSVVTAVAISETRPSARDCWSSS